MDELIAAMEIQMNLHRVIAELAGIGYSGGEVEDLIKSAQRSLENNERVIEHLIRVECATVQ